MPYTWAHIEYPLHYYNLLGIPVFIRRLTAEEVKQENDAPKSSLLDANKEVLFTF